MGLLAVVAGGDVDTAAKCASAALSMQKLARSRHSEATTLFISNTMVVPWTKPLHNCSQPYYDGYVSGIRSGNLSDGMWNNIAHHVMLPYQIGRPLGSIVANLSVLLFQMEEAKLTDHIITLRGFWQTIMNLIGDSNTAVLRGEVFDAEEFAKELEVPHQDAFFGFLSMQLLVVFGKYETAAKLAIEKGADFGKHFPGHFLNMPESFFRGLALYAMARQTKQRKYRTKASVVQKAFQKWRKQGNPNVKHCDYLLSAEHASLKKDYKLAETLYKKAIVSAGRTGYLHHAALSNERYADFLLQVLPNPEEELYYRKEAIRFYNAWGATAKVAILEEQFGERLSVSP